ncbi:thioesterase family protein [Bradyrhizobium sp. USDA 4486]
MPTFNTLLESMQAKGGEWEVDVGKDWLQGRTIYGGLGAALCVEACRRADKGLAPLRSAQFAFIGPVTGRLRLRPTLLRQGKSAAFFRVELLDDAGLATQATLCFAASRSSSLSFDGLACPKVNKPAECPNAFLDAPPWLAFTQHLEARLASGDRPFQGNTPDTMTWIRFRDRSHGASITNVIALADAPVPAALILARQKGIISTMTWSIDMLTTGYETDDGWLLVRTNAETVKEGYSSQSMTMWSMDGKPILVARQNLALFF